MAKAPTAIPGGGKGKSSAYLFKDKDGYKAFDQVKYGDAKSYAAQDSLNALMGSDTFASGTSIFDPVMCELAYTWFCPSGGTILDPFAGGSVRGIVASKLGRNYVGCDLSTRQIEANRVQGAAICADNPPTWINGNSLDIEKLAEGTRADMVFSCPPYF